MIRVSTTLALLFLFVGGCRPDPRAETVRLVCNVSPAPPRVGPAVVNLTVASASGAALTDAKLEIEADMAHPGMAPVLATAQPVSAGRYAAALNFTMPGDWVLIVHGSLPDGSHWERHVPVNGVAAR